MVQPDASPSEPGLAELVTLYSASCPVRLCSARRGWSLQEPGQQVGNALLACAGLPLGARPGWNHHRFV